MTARVALPASLARLFVGMPRTLAAEGETVAAVIADVDRRYPGFRDRLCDTPRTIRRHILVFADGERATLATPVRPGGEILVLPALSGG